MKTHLLRALPFAALLCAGSPKALSADTQQASCVKPEELAHWIQTADKDTTASLSHLAPIYQIEADIFEAQDALKIATHEFSTFEQEHFKPQMDKLKALYQDQLCLFETHGTVIDGKGRIKNPSPELLAEIASLKARIKEAESDYEALLEHGQQLFRHRQDILETLMAQNAELVQHHQHMRLSVTDVPEAERWPENTNIFAGSSQFRTGIIEYTTDNSVEGSFFKALATALPDTSSLEEAFQQCVTTQDRLPILVTPLASTPLIAGWQKADNGCMPRKVLVLQGPDESFNILNGQQVNMFDNDVPPILEALQDAFDLSSEDIVLFNQGRYEALKKQLDDLRAYAQETFETTGQKPELMIIIAAHGTIDTRETRKSTLNPETKLQEGGAIGDVEIFGSTHLPFITIKRTLNEMAIKRLVKDYLGDFENVSIILNSCYSGAFIANAPEIPNPFKSDSALV